MTKTIANLVLEGEFWRDPGGQVWGSGGFGDLFWQRYLNSFDQLVVIARFSRDSTPEAGSVLTSDSRVSFRPLPFYRGIAGFAGVFPQMSAELRRIADAPGSFILRLPGSASNLLGHLLQSRHRAYGVELVGDPRHVAGALGGFLPRVIAWPWTESTRRLCLNSTAVSYVTSSVLQRAYPIANNRPSFSLSSIDLRSEDFTPCARQFTTNPTPLRLVFCGSLEQLYKGPDTLIDAVKILTIERLPIRLTIVGDGRLRPALAERIKAAGIERHAEFLGRVPRDTVFSTLDKSDLFVLPSRTEGLPRAMIEAMARGLPCLGTRVGGIVELLDSRSLVPPNDATALARAIKTCAADPARLTEMSARNLLQAERFSSYRIDPQRKQFYETIREAN